MPLEERVRLVGEAGELHAVAHQPRLVHLLLEQGLLGQDLVQLRGGLLRRDHHGEDGQAEEEGAHGDGAPPGQHGVQELQVVQTPADGRVGGAQAEGGDGGAGTGEVGGGLEERLVGGAQRLGEIGRSRRDVRQVNDAAL